MGLYCKPPNYLVIIYTIIELEKATKLGVKKTKEDKTPSTENHINKFLQAARSLIYIYKRIILSTRANLPKISIQRVTAIDIISQVGRNYKYSSIVILRACLPIFVRQLSFFLRL
jgi:hypothetical protein